MPSIDGLHPISRSTPSSAAELAEALHAADSAGQAVIPYGGGTQLDLGMPPTRADLLLETGQLHRVVEYEPADLTVTVEAGMRFGELQRLLGDNGQFLALDPPADAEASIGGLIATNASGPLRFSYGTARDLVIGTRVANPDGTLTHAGGRVVKNVAGYDLNKLYIGSLGTLGIIVELSFKLAPVPPVMSTALGSFGSLDDVRAVVSAVVHSPLSPLAIELLSPGAAGAAGLQRSYVVALRLGGYAEAVERQKRDLGRLMSERGGQLIEAADTAWDDIAGMRKTAARRRVLLKAAVPLANSAQLVDRLEHQLNDALIWSHAGNGIAYAACDEVESSRLQELRANASLVVQRCPTELKRQFDVWGDPGPSVALMRALKAKLDPKSTLNPGRFVGRI